MEYIQCHVWIFNMFLASWTWNCWQSSRMLTLVCGVHIPCLHNLATTNHPCRPQRLNHCPLQQEIFVFWIFEKQITLSQSKPKNTKLLQKLYSLSQCSVPLPVPRDCSLSHFLVCENVSIHLKLSLLIAPSPHLLPTPILERRAMTEKQGKAPKKESVLHLMYYQHHDLGKF